MTTKAKLSKLFGQWLSDTQGLDDELPDVQKLIADVPVFADRAVAISVREDDYVVVLVDGTMILGV